MAKTKKEVEQTPTQKTYIKLIEQHTEAEIKGANMLYTSMNGNMYSLVSKEGQIGLRLPKEDREAFVEKYNTTLLHTYGAVMREYVTIPDNMLTKTKTLQKYFDICHEYAKTLKPKPTTKKKK